MNGIPTVYADLMEKCSKGYGKGYLILRKEWRYHRLHKEDENTKWKTRNLPLIRVHTADPVGMGRKSRQYTIFQECVQARLSSHTDWISCRHVFGAISSSSILCRHLPLSMAYHAELGISH